MLDSILIESVKLAQFQDKKTKYFCWKIQPNSSKGVYWNNGTNP